jgi:hypothetical protein
MFNVLYHPIVAMLPHRLTTVSDYHPSMPVLSLAVSLIRPQMLVELGVYRGDSLCTMAQACRELALPTRIFGIDTFRGDSHCGEYGDPILIDLESYLATMKYGRVQLIRSTTLEAAPKFRDGTIDLLHIDASHLYEDVKADFNTYLPKLSDKGIVLFHDIYVTERTYGVWKVWQEVKSMFPQDWYEFPHAWGVGLVAIGRAPTPGITELLLLRGSQEQQHLQNFMEALGNRVMDHAALQHHPTFTVAEDPWTGMSGGSFRTGRPSSVGGDGAPSLPEASNISGVAPADRTVSPTSPKP